MANVRGEGLAMASRMLEETTIGTATQKQMTPPDACMPLSPATARRQIPKTSANTSKEFAMIAKSKLTIVGLVIGAAMLSAPVMAQTQTPAQTDVPGHPRVNEVNNRLDNQQNRINNGLKNGTMTTGQADRDETRDANIARRESVDEAKHDGHLTKQEQKNLNKSENRNSRAIYRQKH
jgi:hypothetical protein